MVRIESCSAGHANPIREQPYNIHTVIIYHEKPIRENSHTVIFNQLLYAGMNHGEYFPTASIYNVFFNI